ncbi:MAG TPA: GNAT family N-acetyltransferase [Candidatus Acidoferrum sp.]|nr:GNAT family N-acetyltransferase [Candidatus Acidoferrum sp.]
MIRVQRYSVSQLPLPVIERLNHFSLYTSIGFAALWRSLRGRDVYWVALEDDRMLAALPGVEFHERPLTTFQSMPSGLYARICPLTDERECLYSAPALLKAIAAAGYARVFVNDFYAELPPNPFQSRACTTTVVDLSEPDWRPTNRKTRAEIRKADREGTTVEDFDVTCHLPRFMELVNISRRQRGRTVRYSEDFYRALGELAQSDQRVRWVCAVRDGIIAASHIILVEGHSALWWQLHFDKAYSYAKPNPFLLYTVAQELAFEGVTRINLGMSPEHATGIIAYKEKWGGADYTYPMYVYRSLLGRML